MKEMQRLMVFVSAATITGSLLAAIPDKYQTIVDRNSFGLLPPPPPVSETNAPPPPSDLKVTGFATIGGENFVYVAIPPKDAKTQFKYFALKQGQQESGIEVVEILEGGEVRINNAGVPMVLSLLKNGFQGVGGSQAPAQSVAAAPISQPQAASAIYNPSEASANRPASGMQFAAASSAMQGRASGANGSRQQAYGGNVVHAGNEGAGVIFNAHPTPPPLGADQPDQGTPSFAHFPDTINVKVPDPNASPVIAKDPWIRKQIPMPPLPGRAN